MEGQRIQMEQGKIYFLSYGGNTQIVGRYSHDGTTEYHFYDLLHYWNGFESFRQGAGCYCVHNGISEMRRASKAEIHSLVKHEIENDCI